MASKFFTFLALISIGAALSGASHAARSNTPSGPVITGAEVGQAINLALSAAGIAHRAVLDEKRKFFRCDQALKVEPLRGDWTTARVECPQGWVRHIRTGLDRRLVGLGSENEAAVENDHRRVVLAHSLRAGAVITADHLRLQAVSPRAALGGFSDMAALMGRRLKVPLGENAVLQARHLHPDWMIVKDQIVDIEYHQGHISVVMQGKALENGQYGDMVEVENLSSGEIMNFFVMTAKKVGPRAKMTNSSVVTGRVGD